MSLKSASLGIEQLSGREKVAILLMALGPKAASSLTRTLPPEELEAVTLEIARMDSVPADLAEAVLDEWYETERRPGD
ncbi:MAG: hypothetical protein ACOCVZ_10150 [Gemmatimonadota bacterium]